MFFRRKKRYRRPSGWRRILSLNPVLRWGINIFLVLFAIDLFYVSTIWPDWSALSKGPVPRSEFIKRYQIQSKKENWPRARWRPVSIQQIPDHVQRAVIVGEDGRFYQHEGFDLIAFKEAMDYNMTSKRFAFGASTISQQTVKNMFLNPSRNPLRKWHELLITWGMERKLKKKRILEIYLNIAEFDRGIYGVEAAARHYWHKSVKDLSVAQATELAACLPSPRKHNPRTRTKQFLHRTDKIRFWMRPE